MGIAGPFFLLGGGSGEGCFLFQDNFVGVLFGVVKKKNIFGNLVWICVNI